MNLLRNARAGLVALIAFGWAAQASAQEPVVLKFATTEPPASVATQIWQKWIDQVNKDGAGVIEIKMFAGGALGRDPRNQLTLVQSGVADIAFGFPWFTPGKFPDNLVVSLPTIARNVGEGSYALWRLHEKKMLRGWDDVVPLMQATSSPVIVMSTKPVPNIDALKGLRSSASTPLQMQSVLTLGASPVSGFNFSNSAEAMSRGVLDMDLIGFTPSMIFKQFDVATHALELPLGPSPVAIFMNKNVYDQLSPKAREVLDRNSGPVLVKMWVDAIGARENAVREQWKASPAKQLSTMSDADMKRAETAVAPVIKDWAGSQPNGEALVQAFRDEVDKIRKAR
jgi:TRAP-type C4-dicarboxylate transport system substrate-binding protein